MKRDSKLSFELTKLVLLAFGLFVSGFPSAQASDCDNNGTEDSLDLLQPGKDCNANSYLDSCDISAPYPTFSIQGFGHYTIGPNAFRAVQLLNMDSDPALEMLGLSLDGQTLSIYEASPDILGDHYITSYVTLPTVGTGMQVVDFDGDLKPDPIISTAGSIQIFHTADTNLLALTGPITVTIAGPTKFLAANVAGDSNPDLVVARGNSNQISIFLGTGGGNVGSAHNITAAGTVVDFSLGDFNGDNKRDLAVLSGISNVEVFAGDGSGGFSLIATKTMNGTGRRIFTDDYDGNSVDDLIYKDDQEIVTLQSGAGLTEVFQQTIGLTTGADLIADFDGDGTSDLILGGSLGIFRGRTNGSFDIKPTFKRISDLKAQAVDFDADGLPDIFTADEGGVWNNQLTSWSRDADSNQLPDECQPGLLASPLSVPWNSYLGMNDILELSNPGQVNTVINLEFFGMTGTKLSELPLSLVPGQQFDVLVNQLSGFTPDSYGKIKLTFTGNLEGRMSVYRPRGQTGEYEFAYHVPLQLPLYGNSMVVYNTFDPQTSGSSKELRRVDEWLSLINLSPSEDIHFNVQHRSLTGALISSDKVYMQPGTRMDIAAAPFVSNQPQLLGANYIFPDKPNTPYLAFSTRYGVTTDTKNKFLRYRYAVVEQAQSGLGRDQKIPFGRGGRTESIAELVNPSETANGAWIQIFNAPGSLVTQFPIVMQPYSQIHLVASSYLPAGAQGTLQMLQLPQGLLTTRNKGVVLQGINLVKDSKAKEVISSYSVPGRTFFETTTSGSFNRFLSMNNTLRIISTSGTSQQLLVKTFANGTQLGQLAVALAAHQQVEVDLSNAALGTSTNQYGVVQITTTAPASDGRGWVADILRRRPSGKTEEDFVMESTVR